MSGSFLAEELELVGRAPESEECEWVIGDHVRLNSGGPVLTVLDRDDDTVTVGWRGRNGVHEWETSRYCFKRA